MSIPSSPYAAFAALLNSAGHSVSPAELHGLLLGRSCAGAGFDADAWLLDAADLLGGEPQDNVRQALIGLQEMVSYSAFWGGIGVPTLEVLALLLVPYVDRTPGGVGRWFARERLLANSLYVTFVVVNVVLIIVGTFFRGPNWEFVSPW